MAKVIGFQAIERRLVYFNCQDDFDIPLFELQDAGWNVHVTNDLDELAMLANGEGYHVGLLNMAICEKTQDLNKIESLFELKNITWTALVPSQVENNVAIWQLIYDFCFDYHKLPTEIEQLLNTLNHANGMAQLQQNLSDHQEEISLPADSIIGNNTAMRFLKQKLGKIAMVDAPVLIGGESGTGKELVARAVHSQSIRANEAFEAVNCAALPSTLIQSELFGHEKGAFTGAHHRKKGLFEIANRGTIFLDEIGDLPLELQVILLRVLEQGALRRLGGVRDIRVDVRIVAATHIDLEQAIEEGRFREDLYYRLNVLELKLPPLRDRGEDIDLLAKHFLNIYRAKQDNPGLKFSAQTRQMLRGYDWPGNVRELINRIQRAVVMGEGSLIKPMDLGLERRKSGRRRKTLKKAREQAEKKAVIQALQRTGNQITETARELEVSRITVYRLLEKYGIDYGKTGKSNFP